MKPLLLLAALLLSALAPTSGRADASTSEWRLVKKTWVIPGDSPDIYDYKYDASGHVTEIRNLSGKSLKNVEKDFVYDTDGRISRSSLFLQGEKFYTYEFVYDDQGRLIRRSEITHGVHSGRPDKVTRTQSYRYEHDRIIETGGRSSFGGQLTNEIVYTLDGDGNFVSHTSNASGEEQRFIHGAPARGNKRGPMAYTGAYFSTELQTPYLADEGRWETDGPVTTQNTFDANGLVSRQIITYTTSDGRQHPHTYSYVYAKIK